MVKKLYLTNKTITILFIYYFILFIIGILLSLYAIDIFEIFENTTKKITERTLIGSFSMALCGSSIFYTRKLYKISFNPDILDTTSNEYKFILATFIYFIARPIFSIAFSLILFIGVKSGTIMISQNDIDFNERFIYLMMFISFFVGFSSGSFIKKLESKSSSILDEHLKKENND
jgi:hypothetical protein